VILLIGDKFGKSNKFYYISIMTKYKPSRKLTKADGTIAYTFDNKLHNWEGPALIPEGDNRKREYYLHGIKYTEDGWAEARRNREGLPWYKTAMGQAGQNRN
jgi:hypothetical protein